MNFQSSCCKLKMSSETPASKKLIIKPIVISNIQKMLIKPKFLPNFKLPTSVQPYKDEVIYSSAKCEFIKGAPQEVLIVNRLNMINKSYRTIARCTARGVSVETTSDSVSSVIGQKNYETVLSALSSVFNEETKIRGILSLLTTQKKHNSTGSQTDVMKPIKLTDNSCQTMDTQIIMLSKDKQRKRIKRSSLVPYVVPKLKEVKKCVINIDNVRTNNPQKVQKENAPNLPELKSVQFDDESNMSDGSIGNVSLSGLSNISDSIVSNTSKFFKEIDKVTDNTLNSTVIPLRDGSKIMVPRKPEDIFHIAVPDILQNVTHEEKMKLLWHQAFIDFKMCLEQDEDGYYPLHIAVLNNDVDLVRRQCASLRARRESVDIPAGGLTALHMAVRQNVSVECTRLLLQNGADPLLCDQERRCSFHLAGDGAAQLRALLNYCDTNARNVLKNNFEYWRPELESKTDEELKKYLYECVSLMFDEQGYTPLMAAAEAAIPSNVALLAERAGRLVDVPAPNCGSTALYRAVSKACLTAAETGNKTTVSENVLKTIEILVEHGADPAAENHSGASANTLLTEYNISALSMIIANKMTAMRHGQAKALYNMMVYKHENGNLSWYDVNRPPRKMTEVRNIPPNLHAIITIDVPKSRKYVSHRDEGMILVRDKNGSTDSNKDGTDETNNSNFVNLKEMGLKATGDRISDDHSKQESRPINNVNSDTNAKEMSAKSTESTKTENPSSSANANIDYKNLKMRQVKLGDVILNPKTNVKLSVKDANLNKNNDKNVTIDPVQEMGLKATGDRISEDHSKQESRPINNVNSDTNAKETSAKSIESTKTENPSSSANANIDSKDTEENLKMRRVKLGNVILNAKTNVKLSVKDANLNKNNDKNVTIDPVKVNLEPITFKRDKVAKITNNISKAANLEIASPILSKIKVDLNDNDKKNNNKRTIDSNEQPSRSKKVRKLDKVVIVEDVSLKKGFSMPNILKGGSTKFARPRDIVIASKNDGQTPDIVIGEDEYTQSYIQTKRDKSIRN